MILLDGKFYGPIYVYQELKDILFIKIIFKVNYSMIEFIMNNASCVENVRCFYFNDEFK